MEAVVSVERRPWTER